MPSRSPSSSGRMRWRGSYAPGHFEVGDVVLDTDYTMVCVAPRGTLERAAPQPTGAPGWVWDGTPSTGASGSGNVVVYGQRYTVAAAGWVTAVRVYVDQADPDITYQPFSVVDPLGPTPLVSLREPFAGSQVGWQTVAIGKDPLPVGTVVDIGVQKVDRKGADSSFTRPWDYKTKSGTPGDKEAWHQDGGGEIRFNKTDANENDAGSDLSGVGPGDEIAAGGSAAVWTVVDVDERSSHVRFDVTPAARISEDEYEFKFTSFATSLVDYMYSPDAAPGTGPGGDVSGFFLDDQGYDPNVTLDDHAYGVDVQFQAAIISPDWDFVGMFV